MKSANETIYWLERHLRSDSAIIQRLVVVVAGSQYPHSVPWLDVDLTPLQRAAAIRTDATYVTAMCKHAKRPTPAQEQGQEQGRKDPPARQDDDPYAVLFLLPIAPSVVVVAAYRALSKSYHPDTGGSHDKMVRLNKAYTQIMQESRRKQWFADQERGERRT